MSRIESLSLSLSLSVCLSLSLSLSLSVSLSVSLSLPLSLKQDSQPKRRSQLQDFLCRWKQAKYVIHIALYLDVLTPITKLSLHFQQNQQDPIKAVKRVKDFKLTMTRLTLLIDQLLESSTSQLTFY